MRWSRLRSGSCPVALVVRSTFFSSGIVVTVVVTCGQGRGRWRRGELQGSTDGIAQDGSTGVKSGLDALGDHRVRSVQSPDAAVGPMVEVCRPDGIVLPVGDAPADERLARTD